MMILGLSILDINILIVLLGTTLVLVLVKKSLAMLQLKKRYKRLLRRLLPSVELILWVLLLSWLATIVYQVLPATSPYFWVAIALAVAGAAWPALRDIVSGAILQAETVFEDGDYIRYGTLAGKITKTGYRALEIETDTGDIIKIPYSKLSSDFLVLSGTTAPLNVRTFQVSAPKTLPSATALNVIRRSVLNSPWSSIKRSPVAALSDEHDNDYSYTVTIFALDAAFFGEIEAAVRRALDQAD